MEWMVQKASAAGGWAFILTFPWQVVRQVARGSEGLPFENPGTPRMLDALTRLTAPGPEGMRILAHQSVTGEPGSPDQ